MNVNYPIIDADGHVMEKDTELREFLEGRYREGPHFQTYSFFSIARRLEPRLWRAGQSARNSGRKVAGVSRRARRPHQRIVSHRRIGSRIDPEFGVGLRHLARLQFLDGRALQQAKLATQRSG